MEISQALDFVRQRHFGCWPRSAATAGRSCRTSPTRSVDDGVITVSITDSRAKTQNLRRDPRALAARHPRRLLGVLRARLRRRADARRHRPERRHRRRARRVLPAGERRASRLGRLPAGDGHRPATARCGSRPRTPTGCSADEDPHASPTNSVACGPTPPPSATRPTSSRSTSCAATSTTTARRSTASSCSASTCRRCSSPS